MGPITHAIDAMQRAEAAFRDHDLLTADECRVCSRMLDGGGLHTSDCPVIGLYDAERRLKAFLDQVTS
mgnify:FL=1